MILPRLQAWYGGEETGNGFVDVVMGRVSPSGRLPITFYNGTYLQQVGYWACKCIWDST